MNTNYTYEQIANDLDLINDFYGQHAPMTQAEYDAMNKEQLIALFESMSGSETFTVMIADGTVTTYDNHTWTLDFDGSEMVASELVDGAHCGSGWELIEHRVGEACDIA